MNDDTTPPPPTIDELMASPDRDPLRHPNTPDEYRAAYLADLADNAHRLAQADAAAAALRHHRDHLIAVAHCLHGVPQQAVADACGITQQAVAKVAAEFRARAQERRG